MATSEYEAFDAERRRPLTSNRADVEEYLRGLYERGMGDAPVSPVATFSADLTPKPSEKPSFDSMLGVDFPAFDNVRKRNELELEDDRQATDDMVAAAGVTARPLQGYGAPAGLAAGPRRPLPSAPGVRGTDDGSAGPMNYLAALRRAQQQDDINAAASRLGQAGEQFAEIASRGVYKASPLAPMPSEVAKEEKRRQVVLDYLRQQREDANAAVDNEYKRGLLKRMAEQKPGLTPEQRAEEFAKKLEELDSRINANNARADKDRRPPAPRVVRAPKPEKPQRDVAGEKQAEYERRLNEGIPAGWELQPGAQPTTKQREEAAKLAISREMVNDSISQVRELLKTPGAVTSPRVRDLLAQQGQFIQTQLRVLEDLGVPSGPDAKILETLIGSPASITGEVLNTTQQKLDALGKYVGKRVDTTASTYGLRRKAPAPKTVITKSEEDRLKELEAKEKAGTLGGK